MTRTAFISLLFCSLLLLIFSIVGLDSALKPLLIAAALAYLLFPMVQKIEQYNICHRYAVTCAFTFLLLLVSVILVIIIPILFSEINSFAQDFPKILSFSLNKISEWLALIDIKMPYQKNELLDLIKKHLSAIPLSLFGNVPSVLSLILSNIFQSLLYLINITLLPIFFFYIISDYENLTAFIKSSLPKPLRNRLATLATRTNEILAGYIRGQLLVAGTLAILYATSFKLAGLKFGFLIGTLTGILSIIPYVGITLGICLSGLVILASPWNPTLLISIATLFVLIQLLESFVLTPYLVADKLGINALTTLLALIIGGNLFGLWGMFLAIPTTALIKEIYAEVFVFYRKSSFYSKGTFKT